MARPESLYDEWIWPYIVADMERKTLEGFEYPEEGESMRKANDPRPVKYPSIALGYGAKHYVKVQPKMETFEAMIFEPLTGITELITWLGKDFCALVDGRTPITIAGQQIQRENASDDYWMNMLLVIKNERRNSLVVATPGQWIMKDPVLGYHVFEDDVIRKLYDFTDDIAAQAEAAK